LVPLANVRDNPEHLKQLEEWMRSYRPEELFDEKGRFRDEYGALAPKGQRRMGANPHANGGVVSVPLDDLPDFTDYALEVANPATVRHESTRALGELLRDIFKKNAKQANFRLLAAWLLRRYLPQLKVRVVNVLDLMSLCPPDRHPHGMSNERFMSLFTANKPVIFAFHGYPGVIHQLIHGRPDAARFHARGYIEEGTTTTPFDMVVLNRMSRVHLWMDAVRYAPDIRNAGELLAKGEEVLAKHRAYVQEHFEDLPEVRDWVWSD
jgi:phosphoketolase